MIIYYAPGEGKGKSTRAAAICRSLDVVEVVTTFNDNEPLDRLGVPYKAFLTERECVNYLNTLENVYLICDVDKSHLKRLKIPYVSVYRFGRSQGEYMFSVDPGPADLFFPIIHVDNDQILSREEAREDLGLSQTEHVEMAVRSVARPGIVESKFPNALLLDRDPAVRWLNAADKVQGAIGLNLYSEVTYLGLEAEWVALSPDQKVRNKVMPKAPPGLNRAHAAASRIAIHYFDWLSATT